MAVTLPQTRTRTRAQTRTRTRTLALAPTLGRILALTPTLTLTLPLTRWTRAGQDARYAARFGVTRAEEREAQAAALQERTAPRPTLPTARPNPTPTPDPNPCPMPIPHQTLPIARPNRTPTPDSDRNPIPMPIPRQECTAAHWLAQFGDGQPLTQTLDDPCSICLEPMQRSELVLALQCGHLYHASCVRAWLGRRQWCPLCKAPAL